MPERLLAPEVALSRLDGHVAQEELDLVQFAAGKVAQPRACSPLMPVPALPMSCRLASHADSACPATAMSVDRVHATDRESA